MELHYDDDFLEAVVFLWASGERKGVPSLQIARFHREREKLYRILDPDERNTAFFRLHLEWFREWGLEQLLVDVVKEFPLLTANLAVLAVRKTRSKNDEGAELYVNTGGQRTAVLALPPASFTRNAALQDYIRHEFMHLADMLDAAFGYTPALELPGLNPAQQRLARERYRLLWDISIDGRLAGSGNRPMLSREQHWQAFMCGYSFWTAERQEQVFTSLWQNPAPRHVDLLSLIADPRGLRQAHTCAPGASCPLCGFPTFQWSPVDTLSADLLSRIEAEFPVWSKDQGLCGRCREIYEALAAQV